MERLSALDTEFLHLEDGVAHMHIAGLSVFDGAPPQLDDLVGLVEAKLHLIPRYRQRVRFVPLELGRPVWEDDPHFNLAYHLCHAALPAPRDDAALCRLMGRLMSQPLDRNRPLWETWLIDGLPDGRWALITKVHHCMVDGIAGVELLTVLLAIERDTPLPEPEPWTAASPRPSRRSLVLDAGRGLAGELGTWARRVPGAIRDPVATVRSARRTGEGLVRLGRELAGTRPLSIEGTIGPNRVWAHSSARLDDVRTIRRALGGTVNDVVLAAVAGGYRALLLARGEDADRAVIRSLVPISTRTEGAHGLLDNRVSALLLELPVHVADANERLRLVHDQMRELKASPMAEAGDAVTSAANLAPAFVIGVATRLGMRVMHRLPQRSVNTVTTNVPGPQFPLYCLGREMLEYFPYVPLSHGVRVSTAILSYNGRLGFGVTGDFDTVQDVGVLATAIEAGIEELLDVAAVTLRGPGA
jgi:diacylglycerol O-acyltransferase / wax synthase